MAKLRGSNRDIHGGIIYILQFLIDTDFTTVDDLKKALKAVIKNHKNRLIKLDKKKSK